jgi:hypothetical protein
MVELAKYLVGKRAPGEVGYYKKVNHVARKLRELVAVTIFILVFAVSIIASVYKYIDTPKGYYVPDCVVDGMLYDTDGDGSCYRWVEE